MIWELQPVIEYNVLDTIDCRLA